MAFLIAQAPQGAIDQSTQLISSTVNGWMQGFSMVGDRNRLVTFEACFHHATHVIVAALLVAVLIAQVDFHSRDVIADLAQGTFYDATDMSDHCLVTFDIVVGINLDLHGVLLL
jgi:hypothetical protein